MNQRPLGYEPNELPGCSTPQNHSSNCRSWGQTPSVPFRNADSIPLPVFCRIKVEYNQPFSAQLSGTISKERTCFGTRSVFPGQVVHGLRNGAGRHRHPLLCGYPLSGSERLLQQHPAGRPVFQHNTIFSGAAWRPFGWPEVSGRFSSLERFRDMDG